MADLPLKVWSNLTIGIDQMSSIAEATSTDTVAASTDADVKLRLWSVREPTSQALGDIISRIFVERGHFRNITEESLQEEIIRGKSGASEEQNEQAGVPARAKATKDELDVARVEAMKFTRYIGLRFSVRWK